MEFRSGLRRCGPPRPLPDTFRVFNIQLPERNSVLEKVQDDYASNKQQHPYGNHPKPRHTKCIVTNAKFLNEPIQYIDTDDPKGKQFNQIIDEPRSQCKRIAVNCFYMKKTVTKEMEKSLPFSGRLGHWWPSGESFAHPRPKPPYDKQSTQRNDFQKPACKLSRPIKYSSKLLPSRGIVPLACALPPSSLPSLFREQLSFKYNYNARATPCIPYQGKKRGAFVWTEIKPARGMTVPEATEALPSIQGSGLKGNSVESSLTAPCLCSDSQETSDSSAHLSKTDKADPRASEVGQMNSGISLANEVDGSYSAGEPVSTPARKASPETLQGVEANEVDGNYSAGEPFSTPARKASPETLRDVKANEEDGSYSAGEPSSTLARNPSPENPGDVLEVAQSPAEIQTA